MRSILALMSILVCLVLSCNENSKYGTALTNDKSEVKNNEIASPVIELATVTKNFASFWQYYNQYALLHQDFIAVDDHGKTTTKVAFLEKLKTGVYLPLVFYTHDTTPTFKLVRIPARAESNIGAFMRQDAERELMFYAMKGKPIPKFNFKDIDGNLYTSENTKGKIVLFKCWFIRCGACVLEMPALNEMVQKYKYRKDILFISLAMDDKLPLQKFLAKTRFDYATVSSQTDYMQNQLHVSVYPTHYLINKQGLLVNVVSEEYIIKSLLEKELGE